MGLFDRTTHYSKDEEGTVRVRPLEPEFHPAELELARRDMEARIERDAAAIVVPQYPWRIVKAGSTFDVQKWTLLREKVNEIEFGPFRSICVGEEFRCLQRLRYRVKQDTPAAGEHWTTIKEGFSTIADAESWLRMYLGCPEVTYYGDDGKRAAAEGR